MKYRRLSIISIFLLVSSAILTILLMRPVLAAENPPVIITSDGCFAGRCYIHSGTNNLIFDVGTEVSDNSVYFTMITENVLKRVTSCASGRCIGDAKITCSHGASYQIGITNPRGLWSEDDSGRRLSGSGEFICDEKAPDLLAGNITLLSGRGDDYYKSFDSIIIKANLTEQYSQVNVLADFSRLQGDAKTRGTCTKREGSWQCQVTGVAPDGPIKGDVIVYFSDTANNSISHTFKDINVLKSDETTSIDAWTVKSSTSESHRVNYNPDRFNKDLIRDFNKYIFIDGTFSPTVSGISILKAEANSCSLIGYPQVQLDKTQIQFSPDRQGQHFTMTLAMNYNDFPREESSYTFNCSLMITNQKGKKVITTPEEDWFTFTLTSYHTMTTADAIKGEQEKTLKSIQDTAETIKTYYTFTSVATTICKAALNIKGGSSILEGSAIGAFSSVIGDPVGKTLDTQGTFLGNAADKILENPIGKPTCEMMTCSADWQEYLYNLYNKIPGYGAVSEFSGRATGQDARAALDPYRSEPIAWMTACIPATVYHMQRRNEINCEKLRCLNQDVPAGFPVSQCAEINGYMSCKYTYGGIIRMMPFVNIFQDMTGYLYSMLANPWQLATSAAMASCHWAQGPSLPHSICGAASDALAIPKLIEMINKIQTAIQRAYDKPYDYCTSVINDYRSPLQLTNPFANLGAGVKCNAKYCMVRYGSKTFVQDISGAWYEPRNENSPKEVWDWVENEARTTDVGNASVKLTTTTADLNDRIFLKPTRNGSLPGYIPTSEAQAINRSALEKRGEFTTEEINRLFPNSNIAERAGEINTFEQDVQQFAQEIDGLEKKNAQLLAEMTVDGAMNTLNEVLENKNKINRLKERKRNTNEHIDTLRGQQKRDIAWEVHWKEGWSAYSTAMSFGRVASSISTLFRPDNDWGDYSSLVDDTFGTLNNIAHFEDQLCKVGMPGYKSVNNLVINEAGGRRQSGAHIEGSKEGPQTDAQGRSYYNYLITGAVTPKKGDNFRIKVIARGGTTRILRDYTAIRDEDEHGNLRGYNVTMTDYTTLDENGEPTQTSRMTGKSVTFDFTSLSIIKLEHEDHDYNKVCINFEVENLEDYFSRVLISGNELCNDIVT